MHVHFAVNGPYWIAYDDETSTNYKAQYANYLGLQGAAVWSIGMDDFKGLYSDDSYPIVRQINDVFTTDISFNPENPTCGSAPIC